MVANNKPDNSTSNDELLRLATNAAKAGNKDGARVMFLQVYNRDKRNTRAMLGLARVARNAGEREKWLTRTLKVDPNNDVAQAALKKMEYKTAARENRTLLIFGVIAVALVILVLVVIIIALAG